MRGRTIVLTIGALLAFAGNSLLTRLALAQSHIDAATFSSVRIIAGAVMLVAVAGVRLRTRLVLAGSWRSAAVLFIYAIPFSFAYVSLPVGTGALLLFGAVQVTMMSVALRSGASPHPVQWTGLGMALAGLLYLVLPGLATPAFAGTLWMIVAGVAWGLYSVRGRAATNPLLETTSNFVRAVPMTVAVSALTARGFHVDPRGFALAAASGSITSGLGYVVWYAALSGLGAVRASVVQIAVPVLAAIGGVLLLNEAVSPRLIVAALLVLGGIALTLARRERVAL